jgi:hypothetical protein
MRNCGASARTWCSASCRFFPVADTPRQSRPSHCRCCSRKYRARSGQPDVARGVAAARGRWATPEVWAPPRSEGGIGSSSGSTMNTRPVGLPTSGSAGTSSGGKAKEKNPLVDQGQPLPDRGTAGACSPTRGDRERQRARRPEALPGRAAGPRNLGLRVRGATPAPRQLPRLPRPPAVAARRGVWCSAIRSRPELLLWKGSSLGHAGPEAVIPGDLVKDLVTHEAEELDRSLAVRGQAELDERPGPARRSSGNVANAWSSGGARA